MEWMILGALFLVMVAFFVYVAFAVRRQARHREAMQSWPPAVGTILNVQRTGGNVTEIPEYHVDLEIDDGTRVWHGRATAPLDAQKLMTCQPGMTRPVRYNPANPQDVFLTNHPQASQLIHQIRVRKGLADPNDAAIQRDGVQVQGVLLRYEPTGQTLAGESHMEYTVRLTEPSGAQRDLTKTGYFRAHEMQSLAPGMILRIWYVPGTDQFVAEFAARG